MRWASRSSLNACIDIASYVVWLISDTMPAVPVPLILAIANRANGPPLPACTLFFSTLGSLSAKRSSGVWTSGTSVIAASDHVLAARTVAMSGILLTFMVIDRRIGYCCNVASRAVRSFETLAERATCDTRIENDIGRIASKLREDRSGLGYISSTSFQDMRSFRK